MLDYPDTTFNVLQVKTPVEHQDKEHNTGTSEAEIPEISDLNSGTQPNGGIGSLPHVVIQAE